jgi:hypothetical protein
VGRKQHRLVRVALNHPFHRRQGASKQHRQGLSVGKANSVGSRFPLAIEIGILRVYP